MGEKKFKHLKHRKAEFHPMKFHTSCKIARCLANEDESSSDIDDIDDLFDAIKDKAEDMHASVRGGVAGIDLSDGLATVLNN